MEQLINTVTISIDEYMRLKEIAKAMEEKEKVVIRCYSWTETIYVFPEAGVSNEIIKHNEELNQSCESFKEANSALQRKIREHKNKISELERNNKKKRFWIF